MKAERKSFRKSRGKKSPGALFVYGTLRRAWKHPMHGVLRAHAVLVGAGTFQGKLYDLGRYPGAVASGAGADRVRGEIYALKNPCAAFRALDAYEDRAFRREKVGVRRADGTRMRCWIYLYARPVSGLPVIASGDFLRPRG